jgi:mono/diheme cytochrome c family protein
MKGTNMKNWNLPLILAGAVVVGALALATSTEKKDVPAQPDPVARGNYLVNTIGCADCHTPLKIGANGPEPDRERWLSGHPQTLAMPPAPELPPGPWMVAGAATLTAWAGPWGTSYTANLTPDQETGLGKWTFEQFRDTIRTGRHMGRGRTILPPMPWRYYANLTDEDLRAVFAYLRSVPAVSNRVPEPVPPAEPR